MIESLEDLHDDGSDLRSTRRAITEWAESTNKEADVEKAVTIPDLLTILSYMENEVE